MPACFQSKCPHNSEHPVQHSQFNLADKEQDSKVCESTGDTCDKEHQCPQLDRRGRNGSLLVNYVVKCNHS